MAKRILVTGGAGFLGAHLCRQLLNDGNSVLCLDNFFTGSKASISHLIDRGGFTLIEADVTESIAVDGDVDEIYHLACPASPIYYQENRIDTIRTCILGSMQVLDLALKKNAKVLLASTSEVYGDPEQHPQQENYWGHVNPIGPRSCYDEGKRCAESLFMNYHFHHQLSIKIARIFNTYGPGMQLHDGRVVSNFMVQALQGQDVTIYGDGRQSRSFCYVDDMIDGLMVLMNSPDDCLGPINLGNPNEVTIAQLAETIIDLSEASSRLTFSALPEDDPIRRQPDISLAKDRLHWQPTTALEAGLKHCIDYFKAQLEDTNGR